MPEPLVVQEMPMLQQSPMYAYLPARDVARARQFYETRLGFKPTQESPGGVHYEFGGGTGCFLYPTPNAGSSRASQAFWQVQDIEREVAELRARGVVFEDYGMPGQDANGIVEQSGARAAWFKDTEGNILAIIQPVVTST
jgi:catechol 2,3-dioxygenase-like lactoylglutathione lyase family enzyme